MQALGAERLSSPAGLTVSARRSREDWRRVAARFSSSAATQGRVSAPCGSCAYRPKIPPSRPRAPISLMRETRDLADRVRARWSARWLDRPTPLPEIPLQDLAIDRGERREVIHRDAFV